MALRKVRGHHFVTPLGKIKIECLHEVLLYTIGNHVMAASEWKTIQTNNTNNCISFLTSCIEITLGPICKELGFYLETTMAILNRNDYRKVLSWHFDLFLEILSNLQLNENNATVSKCTIFKLPYNSPFVVSTSHTTYYIIIEISKPFESPKEFTNFLQSDLKGSKLKHFFIIFNSTIK